MTDRLLTDDERRAIEAHYKEYNSYFHEVGALGFDGGEENQRAKIAAADIPALLGHADTQDAALARLREALACLLDDDRGRTYIDNKSTVCLYCGATIRVRTDWSAPWRDHMPHNANCPVIAARALLDGAGTPGEGGA